MPDRDIDDGPKLDRLVDLGKHHLLRITCLEARYRVFQRVTMATGIQYQQAVDVGQVQHFHHLALAGIATSLIILLPVGEQARLHASARKRWKEQAIADVMKRSADGPSVTNELAALRETSKSGDDRDWIGINALLMVNGEYLIYSDINSKEDGRIYDLFIARGSDGRWYYSTFHFCMNMVSARMEDPPGSIAAFAATFFAKEFDGCSDECLRKTWPVKK